MKNNFDEKIEELNALFKLSNEQLRASMETMHRVRAKISELKKADELKHLPKDFLNKILGGIDETRN